MSLSILYEDNHLIAINKRNGELVQGDKTGDEALNERVKAYLKEKYQKPGNVFCGVIHRIDRPVSGIVLFAKTSKALSRMNQMVKERNIVKTYWAIVQNQPPQTDGTLIHYLRKIEAKNYSETALHEKKGFLRAELDYRVLAHSDHYNLLEIKLKTGRHHQIRAQLSAIGCPIKGDLKYGAPRSNPDGSISLHVKELIFQHPVSKQELHLSAPLPEETLWHFFQQKINTL
ncbi:MAG: RluA family pseudouridine synthase [Bacteroidales bacterium]|nr:RluA family pseudouridine synthase [Bacteroidales bacterium]